MSEHADVEDRLRAALNEASAHVEPTADAWARVVERIPSRPRRSRRRLLVPSAVVLAAVVAAVTVVIAQRPGPDDRVRVTGGSGAVEFVPTWLPAGYGPAMRSEDLGPFGTSLACTDGSFVGGHLSCRHVTGAVAWLAASTRVDGSMVAVSTTTGGDETSLLTQLRQLGPSRPASVRGHAGETFRSEATEGVTWLERPGVRVTIIATSPSADLSTLLRVARGLRESSVSSDRLGLVVASAGDLAISARTGPAHSVCVGQVLRSTVGPCRYTAVGSLGFARVWSPERGGTGASTLYGVFPSGVVRIRVMLRGGRVVEGETHEAEPLPGAYVVVQLPRGATVDEVDALDARGGVSSVVPGAWTADETLQDPGPQAFLDGAPIARGSFDGQTWQLRAQWEIDVITTQLVVDGRRLEANGTPATDIMQFNDAAKGFVTGTVGLDVAKVRIQAVDGSSIATAVVRDSRYPVAFFVARIPASSSGYDVTAYDRNGAILGREGVRSSSSSSSSSSSVPSAGPTSSGSTSGSSRSSGSSSSSVTATTAP